MSKPAHASDEQIAWIQEQCVRLGYEIVEPIACVQERAWSLVLRVPTTAGNLYFKSVPPLYRHEAALTQALGHLLPGCVPQVLALDDRHQWFLMADATMPKLADAPSADAPDLGIAELQEALTFYAQLQLAAVSEVPLLEALGCPDRRLARLPELYDAAIADKTALLIGEPHGFSASEYARLQAFGKELPALCAELAAFGIPETIHQDDLHGSNILRNANGYVFFDWSEGMLAHPFFSLVVVLRWAKYVKGCNQADLDHLRNAYLEPWTTYATMEKLRAASTLAQRLGKLCRALTWHDFIMQLEPEQHQEYADAFPYWLYLCVWDVDDRDNE